MKKASIKKISALLYTVVLTAITQINVYASSSQNALENSKLVTGTMNLLSDAFAVICVVSLVAGGLACAYFLFRRGLADNQKKEEWNERIKTSVVCTILIPMVSGLLALILSYYA